MINMLRTYRTFFIESCRREIKGRYMNSGIGFTWLLLNPVMQLLIYFFVFEKIFQIKFNTIAGHDFLSFMAVALWPWVAFSEGLISATNAIDKHKALLQKISLPRFILVLLEVVVPYLIHFLGLVFILLFIKILFSQPIHLTMLPVVLVVYILQSLFCFGLGLLLSSLQVFLKDVGQLLMPIMMVWFYLTPIIYPPNLIPKDLQWLFTINPMSNFISTYRDVLLNGLLPSFSMFLVLLATCSVSLVIGLWVFRRLESRFEDLF